MRNSLFSSRLYQKLCYSSRCCHGVNSETVRVRFAPSPTGYLHLGGLRTALYNFLFAKTHNGKFVLRIEDTDQTRIVDGACEQLQNDLRWAGIDVDEGPDSGGLYGPYVQSQRLQLYNLQLVPLGLFEIVRDEVSKLLAEGSAYYCFCTSKRLDLLRVEANRLRQIPKYDNKCRHLTDEEVRAKLENSASYCIRFKLSSGPEEFNDLVYGKILYDLSQNEGDPVVLKSDGYPTYHFANVVDDHHMRITHVLRGVEWQISTTKHLMMYRAFKWKPPLFGHLPLLLNPDGSKLSKRQGDIRVASYRESGIFPLALVNYITSSGGGFEKDEGGATKPTLYAVKELSQQFKVGNINTNSGKLMPDRLKEFNRLELKRKLENKNDLNVLVEQVRSLITSAFPERPVVSDDYIKNVLSCCINRINRLDDLVSNKLLFLWVVPEVFEKTEADHAVLIQKLVDAVEANEDLTKDELKLVFSQLVEQERVEFAWLMKLLRSILSGLKEGPSVLEMVGVLGKENTLSRLRAYLDHCKRM